VAAKHQDLSCKVVHRFSCARAEKNLQNKFEDSEAKAVRVWLEGVMRVTGLKATPLAKVAGIAPSTLLRALDPDNPTTLERRTVRKISSSTGVSAPGANGALTGFEEAELTAYTAGPDAEPDDLPPNQYRRICNTRALTLAGFLPGDVLTLDMSLKPEAGDAVDAQVYAINRATAETIFRLYDPPYLITRTTDETIHAKPLLVDSERVRIAAVVHKMERWIRK
jgi:DNA-binding phage protein